MITVALCLLVFVGSAVLTRLMVVYAIKRSLLDIPNSRSSHHVPTPRGGGLAIIISFFLALIFLYYLEKIGVDLFATLIGGGTLVALIGFWDDHHHISALGRITVHCAAAMWVLFWLGGFPVIHFSGDLLELGWFGFPAGVLLLVWLINLFNFMDGIDGIAGAEAIFILLSASVLIASRGSINGFVLLLIGLASASCGFLVWNWPPAKIFMGDVGSGFLGLMLGALAFGASIDQNLSLWSWLILFGVFFVDATVTLIRRIFRGDRWYEAHRSHAYQIASRRWGSHKKVTLTVIAINIFWLFPIAAMAALWPNIGVFWLIVSYLPLVFLALRLGAGNSHASNI